AHRPMSTRPTAGTRPRQHRAMREERCMAEPLAPIPLHQPPGAARPRRQAVRAGVRVEIVTVAWMSVEAVVAIGAGLLARSVLLTAFGIDSVIELVSGGVLLWRLVTEARAGSLERVERAEHRAAWVVGVGLSLLCVYVVASAGASLLTHSRPDSSIIGIALASAAVIGMPILAWRK